MFTSKVDHFKYISLYMNKLPAFFGPLLVFKYVLLMFNLISQLDKLLFCEVLFFILTWGHFFFFAFRERERELGREKETWIGWLPPTRAQTRDGSTHTRFGCGMTLQPTEPHRQGQGGGVSSYTYLRCRDCWLIAVRLSKINAWCILGGIDKDDHITHLLPFVVKVYHCLQPKAF